MRERQVTTPKEELTLWQARPMEVVSRSSMTLSSHVFIIVFSLFSSYIIFFEVLLTKFRFIQSELKSGEEAISAPEVTPCQRAKLCTKQSQSNFEDN